MKKACLVLLVVAMALSLGACASKGESPSLYERGLDLTAELGLLAQSRDYIALYSASDAIASTAAQIAGQDYDTPRAVYEITGLEEAVLQALLGDTGTALDQDVEDMVKKRMGASVASQINARNGAEFLATTAILTREDHFLYEGLHQSKTFLYLYGSDYGSMVTFVPFGDNIVEATANIVMQQGFAQMETAQDMAAFFEEQLGLLGVTVAAVAA